jgi:Sigma-70 region 2
MREDLVERARRGDREAFGQLAAGDVDRLNAIARLVLRDPDLAEDAVQEALVRGWRQLDELVTVGVVGDAPLFVVVEPTEALRGVRAGQVTWVGVHS